MGGGTGGWETGRKGDGRCTGGGRRGGGKRDSQGGGKREKKGKITQHCAKLCNSKNAKRRESTITGRELGLKGTGSGRFRPSCPPPHPKEKRAGGVWEVKEEGVGSRRNRESYPALCKVLQSKKHKEVGVIKNRAGTRIKVYRKQEV